MTFPQKQLFAKDRKKTACSPDDDKLKRKIRRVRIIIIVLRKGENKVREKRKRTFQTRNVTLLAIDEIMNYFRE